MAVGQALTLLGVKHRDDQARPGSSSGPDPGSPKLALRSQRPMTTSPTGRQDNPLAWAGYAAFVLAALFGGVSLYWAAGGTRGLDTLGGSIERLARSKTRQALALDAAVIVLKLAGAVLALALVHPWTKGLRLLRIVAGLASVGLIAYGLIEISVGLLVETDVVRPHPPVDWYALRWHLELWDPWFFLWGLSLALAA